VEVSRLSDVAAGYIARRRGEGKAAATIRYELAVLRRGCRLAVERRRLSSVPWLPRVSVGDNVRRECPTEEEVSRLIEALPGYLARPVLWASWTGCRREEVFGLRWDEVERERGVVRLSAERTKNGGSRVVPYGAVPVLVEMLEDLHRRRGRSEFVFLNRFGSGRIADYRAGNRTAWRKGLLAAGVPWLRFHDCRRLAVARLVRAGVPQLVVQRIIGHRTAAMVGRYFQHTEADLAAGLGKAAALMGADLG
jgi:integrase